LKDKVFSKLNFLDKNNIQKTVDDLKNDILQEKQTQRFFLSLVLQRISNSENLHENFSNLITKFNSKELIKTSIDDTVEGLKKILLYDEELSQSGSKTAHSECPHIQYIKNLSKFLGLQTLAKNRPLFSKDLDLKQLLFDGCENKKEY
jgi:CCR4-NOT transcription complex subunit 1